jgi:hypothetical protein
VTPSNAKPWETEPDSKEWVSSGYRCSIKRVKRSGHLCGYVTIPDSHPWFGLTFNDDVTPISDPDMDHGSIISAFCHALREDGANGMRNMDLAISVHGGVTYGENEGYGWTIGFDCAHSGDHCPASEAWFVKRGFPDGLGRGDVYRDMDYVTAETCRLAAQLKLVEERGTR